MPKREKVSLLPLRGAIIALGLTAVLITTGVFSFWRAHRQHEEQSKRLMVMDDLVWQAILVHDARASAAEMAVLSGDVQSIKRYRSLAAESNRVSKKLHAMGITKGTEEVLASLDALTRIEDRAIGIAEQQSHAPSAFLQEHADAATQHRLSLEALPRETARQRTILREKRIARTRQLIGVLALATATLALSSLLIVRTMKRQLLFKRDAEHRYAEASRQNRLILEATADGIIGIDHEGNVVFFNPAAARMTGVDPQSGLPPSHHILTALDSARVTLMPVLMTGLPVEPREFDLVRGPDSMLPTEISAAPLRDEDGAVCGGVFTIRDVTQRRELDRMKSQFVTTVSHELRTPLTAIRGSLSLITGGHLGTLAEKGQRLLNIAINNADRLSRLVNDILDLERIKSDDASIRRVRCNAGDLVMNTSDTMRCLAEGNGMALLASPAHLDVRADGDRIVQVLTNLIGNAIKFSAAGSTIDVGVRQKDGEAIFHVRDNGRGIPPEKLEAIFGRFQQVDASDATEKGGTGLGLAICRSIVEEHGGRIWVESCPGEGSTFAFTIPLFEEGAETGSQSLAAMLS
jgi:PAS domain S-box-containing protein